MAKSERRSAEGSSPRSVGSPLPSNKVQQSVPPGVGFFSPFVPTAGDTAGDTVYFLLNSIFDPRTLQTDSANRYSTMVPGQDYRSIWQDLIYQIIFSSFRMRQEPNATVISEMMDVICDTTRMLGIYLSALSMSASRDPDMFARSRILNLFDAKVEMQSMLASLPLPRMLVELSLKYVGLVDVAGSYNFQNVGFLCNGDYSDFTTLYANVMAKPLARNYLRQIYPEIGLIGDPDGTRNAMDILQMFINANVKETSDAFVPYVLVDQATDESLRLQSGGLLCSTSRSGNRAFTVTGWAVPGTGIGAVGSVRTWFPSLCVWKSSSGRDAALVRSTASQAYSFSAPTINVETQANAALCVNLVHEYNMNIDNLSPAYSYTSWNSTSGSATASDALATDNTRYRVSAGFSLGSLSYDLQANIVSAFRDIMLP